LVIVVSKAEAARKAGQFLKASGVEIDFGALTDSRTIREEKDRAIRQ